MRIAKLDTYFLAIPLPQPVRTSINTISQVSEVVVKLTTDSGLVGIGEGHGPFLQGGETTGEDDLATVGSARLSGRRSRTHHKRLDGVTRAAMESRT